MIAVTAEHWYDDYPHQAYRYPSEFALELAAQGFTVAYICSNLTQRSKPIYLNTENKVHIVRYPYPTQPNRQQQWEAHIEATYEALRILNTYSEIRLVNAYDPLQAAGAFRFAQEFGTKSLYSIAQPFRFDEIDLTDPNFVLPKQISKGKRQLVTENLKKANEIHFYSDYAARNLSSFLNTSVGEKELIKPHWTLVDSESSGSSENRADLRVRLNYCWDYDGPILVHFGPFDRTSGWEVILEAAGKIKDEVGSFRIIFSGDGPDKKTLLDRIHDLHLDYHVFVVDSLPLAERPNGLGAANCLLLASPIPAGDFGLAADAYSCGIPVIAPETGAYPELINRSGDFGYPPGDSAALADKLRLFLTRRLRPQERLRPLAAPFQKSHSIPFWLNHLALKSLTEGQAERFER